MASPKPSPILLVLAVVLPLAAVTGLVTASYLVYRALSPEPVSIEQISPFSTSPEVFSRGLEPNLRAVLEPFGITDTLIRTTEPDSTMGDIGTVYRVRIPRDMSLRLLNVQLTSLVNDMGGRVFSGIENTNGTTLTLRVGARQRPTDAIILEKSSRVETKTGKMAIIIDDLGNRDLALARRLTALPGAVTLAIMPFRPHTRDVVNLARDTGTPYILHMPMEASSSSADPGEGAITTEDPDDVIHRKLERAFDSVDGAPGGNNHMGSKATENLRVMESVMAYFGEHGYFFVDSQTSRQSQGYPVSQRTGVKGAKLTSYLDVEDDSTFIADRLLSLAERAFAGELVVAIGHERPNTVTVLEELLPRLAAEGMVFVAVRDVVR